MNRQLVTSDAEWAALRRIVKREVVLTAAPHEVHDSMQQFRRPAAWPVLVLWKVGIFGGITYSIVRPDEFEGAVDQAVANASVRDVLEDAKEAAREHGDARILVEYRDELLTFGLMRRPRRSRPRSQIVAGPAIVTRGDTPLGTTNDLSAHIETEYVHALENQLIFGSPTIARGGLVPPDRAANITLEGERVADAAHVLYRIASHMSPAHNMPSAIRMHPEAHLAITRTRSDLTRHVRFEANVGEPMREFLFDIPLRVDSSMRPDQVRLEYTATVTRARDVPA